MGKCPLEMLKSVSLLQMLSKTLVNKVFMHHFEKKRRQLLGALPQTPTGELLLNPAGGLPSFRPLTAHPRNKIRGSPCTIHHLTPIVS